jgi:hypothetical protein
MKGRFCQPMPIPFRLALTWLNFTASCPLDPVISRHFASSSLSLTFDFRAGLFILTVVPVMPRGTMSFRDFPGFFFNFASKICPLLAGFSGFIGISSSEGLAVPHASDPATHIGSIEHMYTMNTKGVGKLKSGNGLRSFSETMLSCLRGNEPCLRPANGGRSRALSRYSRQIVSLIYILYTF